MTCQQCPNPALVQVGPNGGVKLCLPCYSMLQKTVVETDKMYQRQMDMLTDQMEMITGISARPHRPAPTYIQGPVTNHNIRIDRSVVGSINTGHIDSLNVSLDRISNIGANDFSRQVAGFSEAVMASPDLTPEAKKDVVEQLAFSMEEVQKPAGSRKKSVVLSSLNTISTTVGAIKGLHDLWVLVEPTLRAFF